VEYLKNTPLIERLVMQNIQIDTGDIRLSINDDEARIITFNPKDSLFSEKFYHLVGNFHLQLGEFQKRAEELDADKSLDENSIPFNIQAKFDLIKETCDYVRKEIDVVFGEGTSQIVFGDVMNLEIFPQFFEGISPFFKEARKEKVEKYIPHAQKPKRVRRK